MLRSVLGRTSSVGLVRYAKTGCQRVRIPVASHNRRLAGFSRGITDTSGATPRQHMYLIDSLALIYRAHFAFADHKRLKTTSGIDTTAAYGYLRYLLAVLREEPVATHIVACFDGPAGPHASRSVLSWRNTLFPDYKAGRSPTPLEVIDAIPTLQVRGWSSLLSHVDRDELSVAFSPLFFFCCFRCRKPCRDLEFLSSMSLA